MANADMADQSDRAPAAQRQSTREPELTLAVWTDTTIVGIVAEKILLAWLRNRRQLFFPFAMDLRRLDPDQFDLLVHAMIAAARSDGSPDSRDRHRIDAALERLGAQDDDHHRVRYGALAHSKPLDEILGRVHDAQAGALVYAASLLVLDVRKTVNRRYLDYLAARLNLSDELIASLETRFQSAG